MMSTTVKMAKRSCLQVSASAWVITFGFVPVPTNTSEVSTTARKIAVPEFQVAVKTPEENGKRKAFRLGDRVDVDIQADYYFGGPVPNAATKQKLDKHVSSRFPGKSVSVSLIATHQVSPGVISHAKAA